MRHRTLRAFCERLGELASRVVAPVHVFDLPPQVMRGLFSVALVTGDGELHRCVLPYQDAAVLIEERRRLARLLLRVELDQVAGRIEVGANTGALLRYFLPDGPEGEQGKRHQDRSHGDWHAAAERAPSPRQLWQVGTDGEAAVGGITAGGVHHLVRLRGDGAQRLESARRRLGCRIVGRLPAASALARDVLGEWQE